MNGGAFKIPEFPKHSSNFIESLLMGLPVPAIAYQESLTYCFKVH